MVKDRPSPLNQLDLKSADSLSACCLSKVPTREQTVWISLVNPRPRCKHVHFAFATFSTQATSDREVTASSTQLALNKPCSSAVSSKIYSGGLPAALPMNNRPNTGGKADHRDNATAARKSVVATKILQKCFREATCLRSCFVVPTHLTGTARHYGGGARKLELSARPVLSRHSTWTGGRREGKP